MTSEQSASRMGAHTTCPNGNEFCANAPGNDDEDHIECLSCYQDNNDGGGE